MSKPAHTIGNVRADIPPRCGMSPIEVRITIGGLIALPFAAVATVAAVGYLPEILRALAAALRGL